MGIEIFEFEALLLIPEPFDYVYIIETIKMCDAPTLPWCWLVVWRGRHRGFEYTVLSHADTEET